MSIIVQQVIISSRLTTGRDERPQSGHFEVERLLRRWSIGLALAANYNEAETIPLNRVEKIAA